MVSSDESEATTTVHTEPGGTEERDAYEPFRVASRNPQVPAYRAWWRSNPLNNLRAAGKANLWSRFQKEVVEGKSPLEAAQGPYTTTLDDLKQTPIPSDVEELLAGKDQDLPSDEVWWGTPDADVYKASTTHLNKQQIDEECEKGNIITLRRFREHLEHAEDWELEVLRQLMTLHQLKHKVMVPLGDGGVVSFWDLYKYIKCNPQLEALAAKGVNAVQAADGMTREERIRLLEEVAPWMVDPEADSLTLPASAAQRMPWGLLSSAPYFSRRPTRWLKGLDGRQDLSYGLYVHEEAAAAALGPKWAGKGATQVLGSPDYYDDLLAAGPLVGMTLLAVTSRPLPLEEAVSSWSERLSQNMERMQSSKEAGPSPCCAGKAKAAGQTAGQTMAPAVAAIPRPVFGPAEVSREKLSELVSLFDRSRLLDQTKLLDETGTRLREGTSLLLSAAPGGTLLVQAISPGKVREQEHYYLGEVEDQRVAAAVFDMFLHPQRTIDPAFAFRSAYSSLWFVNGFRSNNSDKNPNVRGPGDTGPRVPRLARRGRGATWRLPAPGQDPTEAAPEMVWQVKRRVMHHQVHTAFTGAWRAADEVERGPGMDDAAFIAAKRAAAEGALRRAIGGLGLNVQGLALPLPPAQADLAASAAPLQVP